MTWRILVVVDGNGDRRRCAAQRTVGGTSASIEVRCIARYLGSAVPWLPAWSLSHRLHAGL